jgi:hypothetical protein
MDRQIRMGLGGAAALLAGGVLLCTEGCRSTRSEVPAGKPYQTTGAAPPTVGFSQEPRPSTASGMAGLYGNRGPGALVQDGRMPAAGQGATLYGTPTPGTSLGLPTANQYGPPGTAGTGGASPGGTGAITTSLLNAQPPVSQVLAKDPGASTNVPGSPGSAGGSYP